jgi:hypothetical protein
MMYVNASQTQKMLNNNIHPQSIEPIMHITHTCMKRGSQEGGCTSTHMYERGLTRGWMHITHMYEMGLTRGWMHIITHMYERGLTRGCMHITHTHKMGRVDNTS